MDVQKERSSASIPEKITSVSATTGDNDSEIDLSWDKVQVARSYVVETALADASPVEWKHVATITKTKAEIVGLQTGTRYQLRVAAVGSAGQGPWSDPVFKVAP